MEYYLIKTTHTSRTALVRVTPIAVVYAVMGATFGGPTPLVFSSFSDAVKHLGDLRRRFPVMEALLSQLRVEEL